MPRPLAWHAICSTACVRNNPGNRRLGGARDDPRAAATGFARTDSRWILRRLLEREPNHPEAARFVLNRQVTGNAKC